MRPTADRADDVEPPCRTGGRARRRRRRCARARGRRPFWLLAGGFSICGLSTNGLISTHFVPAAHDHGMPATTAAGLLAVVGIFDIVGTVASGWLTDRVDPRLLLVAYYGCAACRCSLLPTLLGPTLHAEHVAFIVFYGLDWVATVPPTVALCREHFGARAPCVFGWVFASHQLGAAVAAFGGGVVRDVTGTYDLAWFLAGGLCVVAAAASISIRRNPPPPAGTALPTSPTEAAAAQAHG